jgi:hypothetical protein
MSLYSTIALGAKLSRRLFKYVPASDDKVGERQVHHNSSGGYDLIPLNLITSQTRNKKFHAIKGLEEKSG